VWLCHARTPRIGNFESEHCAHRKNLGAMRLQSTACEFDDCMINRKDGCVLLRFRLPPCCEASESQVCKMSLWGWLFQAPHVVRVGPFFPSYVFRTAVFPPSVARLHLSSSGSWSARYRHGKCGVHEDRPGVIYFFLPEHGLQGSYSPVLLYWPCQRLEPSFGQRAESPAALGQSRRASDLSGPSSSQCQPRRCNQSKERLESGAPAFSSLKEQIGASRAALFRS
jgi:hypothetical protein